MQSRESTNTLRVKPRKRSDPPPRQIRVSHKNNVLKEIYAMQKFQGTLFRRLPFARLVKQTIQDIQMQYRTAAQFVEYRISFDALDGLQQATEAFLVDLFAMCQLTAEHSRRVTIMDRDVLLVLRIRKLFGMIQ